MLWECFSLNELRGGVEVTRWAHNPETAGSSPAPAMAMRMREDLKKVRRIVLGLECPKCKSIFVIWENGYLKCESCDFKWKPIGEIK